MVSDPETEEDEFDPKEGWGVKHIGAVPSKNVIGYHKLKVTVADDGGVKGKILELNKK